MSGDDYSGIPEGGRWMDVAGVGLALIGTILAVVILGAIAYFVLMMTVGFGWD
jgi:hypothetical protein